MTQPNTQSFVSMHSHILDKFLSETSIDANANRAQAPCTHTLTHPMHRFWQEDHAIAAASAMWIILQLFGISDSFFVQSRVL